MARTNPVCVSERCKKSFWKLSGLRVLRLSFCQQLRSLPQGALIVDSIVHLSSLNQLALRDWDQLTSLPDSFGQLSALEELDLWRCSQLQFLPDSLARLPALRQVDLYGCEKLTSNLDALADPLRPLCRY
eukprot:GHUV01041319.1.p1 GENE.GHUV01041319.1~~GHUV01041319.1.p1  ORF type:complete len:150 (+),score=19.84 GHUV01041319.1:63-452(+)